MINLLPPDFTDSYRYAQRNVVLRKWVALSSFALVGLFALFTYGLLTIHQTTVQYQHDNASTEALFKKEKYTETQARIKEISGSFRLATQVLGNEVLFSKLITQIGSTIPSNASLTSLSINQSQSAIDISASAADYTTATQLQVNLSDPTNKIFSKADIVSINCKSASDSSSDSTQQYPCTVNIRALFAPNNPYLLVNSKGKAK